jgi:hypothetical protein
LAPGQTFLKASAHNKAKISMLKHKQEQNFSTENNGTNNPEKIEQWPF